MDAMATATKTVDQRIERLSTASLNRIVEPDVDVPGEVGDGQVLPDELLSLADLPELLASLTASRSAPFLGRSSGPSWPPASASSRS